MGNLIGQALDVDAGQPEVNRWYRVGVEI